MHNVSENYKEQINKTVRNISYLKVNFGIVNNDASKENTMTDNGHLFYSDVSDSDSGKEVVKRYHTMERNKFILDGSGLLPPENGSFNPYYQGFVGTEVSDASGNFTTVPKVTINFSFPLSFIGLTFRFNKQHNNYPSQFTVKAYSGVTLVYDSLTTPLSYDFVLDEQIENVDKIELYFNKMAVQYRRAELEYIMFGIVASFADDLTSSTWTRSIDIISTVLPKNDFNFTVIDLNKNYDPENPTGIWKYLENRQPVWFEYGYELDDGSIEWVSGSHLYSNGEVKLESVGGIPKVSFSATSSITSLEDEYYRGVYNPNGISLYDLALDVFSFANLPLIAGGITPYVIAPELQYIITKVPVPELPVNQCLQLIANAGRCVIEVNRIGQIEIKRLTQINTGFHFTFDNIKNPPSLVKSPYLLEVDTFCNTVTISAESSQVHTSNVDLPTATECQLKYEMSTDLSIAVGAGVTIIGTPQFYAGSCIVTLQGTGTVAVMGKKLVFSKDSVTYNANPNGFICPVENILLNTSSDAYAYAEWIAQWLVKRNTYTISDRGYPELDMMDFVYADTLFSQNMPSTILSSKLSFNGALSGETTFLANEVV